MLKWAVAKDDHPSSKTKSSTKSLKKRRKQSHHHHYCSILKSGVCLRIENAVAAKKAASSSSPPSTAAAVIGKGKVVEDSSRSAGSKLTRKSGDSGSAGANNTNNHCRGLYHGVQRSTSSSRFRLKVSQQHLWTANNMGNNLPKSAASNERESSTEGPHCTACPSGDVTNNVGSSISHGTHTAINPNNTNNNTSNQNNNKPKQQSSGGDISSAGAMTRNNAKNSKMSSGAILPGGAGKCGSVPIPSKNSLSPNKGSNPGAERGRSGNAVLGGNAGSKSLLYMSLDHLPLAIVKQYERMLQESTAMDGELPAAEDGQDDALKKPSEKKVVARPKKVRSSSALSDPSKKPPQNKESTSTSSMPAVLLTPPVTKTRSSIIKQIRGSENGTTNKSGKDSNQPKKITIISPPKSKQGSDSAHANAKLPTTASIISDREQSQSNKKESGCRNQKSSKSSLASNEKGNGGSIKEARNRPLQMHVSACETSPVSLQPPSPKKKSTRTKQTSPSPPEVNNKEKCTQAKNNEAPPKPKSRFKVTIVNSPVSSDTGVTTSKKVNDVKTKDASCAFEPKLFPLKSILKDCKSSTLPRMRNQDLKPKKSNSRKNEAESNSNPEKNAPIYGRSSSFRSTNNSNCTKQGSVGDHETFLCSPLSSRKLYQSLHDIYTLRDEQSFKVPRPPSSSSTSTTASDLNSTSTCDTGMRDAIVRTPIREGNATILNDHDITDPQFLEEPMPISTPAVSRCAKKLTFKRSEIRKLERIRTQTEKLNRFLKKYYHDCLPNLPEEEEEQCSPEEKSVHLSVLRTHWIEKAPEEPSTSPTNKLSGKHPHQSQSQPQRKPSRQRRNTLPHPDFSAAAIEQAARAFSARSTAGESSFNENADCTPASTPSSPNINSGSHDNVIKEWNDKNTSLLSSSAYYSDPILSSLPIIVEDPEVLLHHQLKKQLQIEHGEQEKQGKTMQSNKMSAATRTTSCSSTLINNNNNKISSSSLNNVVINNESRRSSSVSTGSSCSCSCSTRTSASSSGSCCNTSKCSSTASSIINLANEFRMAEVIRHDNNIHESFLMSTHNFPLEDNSLLLLTEKEFGGARRARCIPTVNDNAGEDDEFELEQYTIKAHQNCESSPPPSCNIEGRGEGGNNTIDSFAIASPVYKPEREGSATATRKDCRRTKSDNNNNSNEQLQLRNKSLTTCNNNGNKSKKVTMIPFASSSSCNSSAGSSSSNSINSVDEVEHSHHHGIIEEEGADHCFGPEKLKDYTRMMMMMGSDVGGEGEPLGNNNPFDVPASLAEDEGFMSPYPPEAYSPASSSSSNSNTSHPLNRLSISSGKGSAEDYDDERRLELFFLDSSCESSILIEQQQQIAAYKQQQQHEHEHEYHLHHHQPELIHISGEKSLCDRLVSPPERGHGCVGENVVGMKGADDDEDNNMKQLISSPYHPYYQRDREKESNAVDDSPDMKEESCSRIPFHISPGQVEPGTPQPPPRTTTTTILLENSNYLQRCDENGTWDSHDYATIVGVASNSSTTSGSSSSSTSTYAACGSFFPNPNLLLQNHHERQVSSDSSSTAAFSLLNECENDHNHQHFHHCHHHEHHDDDHLYDEVASSPPAKSNELELGDNDFHTANSNDNNNEDDDDEDDETQQDSEEEESVIIQSSEGNATGGSAGIAFSTPIQPRPRLVQKSRRNHPSQLMMHRMKNTSNNYSQCGSFNAGNSILSKSSFCSSVVSSVSNRSISMRKYRYSTPRKVVKKPPVKTPFSDRGEVLIRCYRNGDYVTVHVVQVKNLQMCYRSSWKLSMKISLIPEGEATFTKSESVVVPRARRFVRIDQKFSFEIPQRKKSQRHHYTGNNYTGGEAAESLKAQRKLFLTFVKRIEKRSTFLGWITLEVPEAENTTQCWLKLRKRKMSSASYSVHSTTTNHLPHNQSLSHSASVVVPVPAARHLLPGAAPPCLGGAASTSGEAMVGLPSHIETLEQGVVIPSVPSRSCKSPECYQQDYIGKTQLQNSSTMDSGVEDCCEPPPVPSIELDEKLGFRVRVHMTKPGGSGFGFSVVWVSPPRIERLEKDKTADLAGLKIGDLIIGVNGEDVTTVANTTIYNKMKTTGMELDLEVWRKHPHVTSPLPPHLTSVNVPQPTNPAVCVQPQPPPPPTIGTSSLPPNPNSSKSAAAVIPSDGRDRDHRSAAHSSTSTTLPQQHTSYSNCNNVNVNNAAPESGLPTSSTATTRVGGMSNNPLLSRIIQSHPPPPTSILKPPPPAPPVSSQIVGNSCPSQSQQTTGSSSWRNRFNIELLDNEDDNLKQFFICELKFFRKVVAALDRYLIPAQANRLLTPQEIHVIFAQVIKIITMTKRILQCVANGSNNSSWKLGRILLSTHSDHLPDITSAYTAYARGLGNAATILSEKMSIQDFAKFVLETPVPKGHLDMTSLLFAPFEHLRNLCEIAEEISHQHDNWVILNSRLKECYADIVCETDFMEPISHISMKKNPLVSVRDLEKRIISTTSQQPLKVCEKGRRWLFGSRLYRRENDGSWSPVWAFLFTDIIVLTSHMTRDRVFFVKESPIRLDDVVTLHFNLPKKHENEFRLLFGPDTSHHSRLDRILPLVRSKKSNQIVLRTANVQLKSLWKLLLQRQIISLNTRLSKSSSSNFSISEFCEKFPVVQHDSIMEEDEEKGEIEPTLNTKKLSHLQPNPSAIIQVTQRSTEPNSLSHNVRSLKPQIEGSQIQSQKVKQLTQSPMPGRTDSSVGIKSFSKGLHNKQQPQQPDHIELKPGVGGEIKQGEVKVTKESQNDRGSGPTTVTSPTAKPYVPDGFSSLNRDLLRTRVVRPGAGDRRPSVPPSGGMITTSTATDILGNENKVESSHPAPPPVNRLSNGPDRNANQQQQQKLTGSIPRPAQHDQCTSTVQIPQMDNLRENVTVSCPVPPVPKARTSLSHATTQANHNPQASSSLSRNSTPARENSSSSPIPSHNNNNTIDNMGRKGGPAKCPCEKINDGEMNSENGGTPTAIRRESNQPTAYPSPKPRQLSKIKRMSGGGGTDESKQITMGSQICNHDLSGNSPKNDAMVETASDGGTPSKSRNNGMGNDISHDRPSSSHISSTGDKSLIKAQLSKEKEAEPHHDVFQSPLMVKRAAALASGSATPSSSSSLSPARLPVKVNDVTQNDSFIPNETSVSNGSLRSKPGSKIMTNAILKSRQQERIAQNLQTSSVSTETLRTEKSSDTTASTSKTDSASTQYFSLKEESTTTSSCSSHSQQQQQLVGRCIHKNILVHHHQHHSHHCPGGCSGTSTVAMITTERLAPGSPHLSVPPRCHSELGHHPKKPVHTDSPIIPGYGSERTRRRMLVDNKLKKDYPELFGITPKDRRTFIKQLGEENVNSEGLVAPYYYTLSPMPLPKHVMMSNSKNGSSVRTNTRRQGYENDNVGTKSSPFVIPPFNPNNGNGKQHPIKTNEERSWDGRKPVATTRATSTATTSTSTTNTDISESSSVISNSIKQRESRQASTSTSVSGESSMCHNFEEQSKMMMMMNDCSTSSNSGSQTQQPFSIFPTDSSLYEQERMRKEQQSANDYEDDACGLPPHLAHDVFQASLELDEDGERLKAFVEKMREDMSVGGVITEDEDEENDDEDEEDEDDDEEEEEDSDDSTAGGHEEEEEHGQSHRSHEESSNDSGISDEMTEKSKTTLSGLLEEDERSLSLSISRRNENFSNMLDRMRSGVLAAEVKNPEKISSSSAVSNSTTPVANSNTAHAMILDHSVKSPVVVDDDVGNIVHVVDNNNCCSPNNANKTQYVASAANHSSHVCCTSNSKSHVVDDHTLCFLEGETKASVATMVVLKVDKATETEDKDFEFLLAMNNDCNHPASHPHHPTPYTKPIRSILAERREAFFLSQESSFTNPHHPFTNSHPASGPGRHNQQHSIHFAEDFPTYAHSHHHGGYCASGNSGVSGACCNCGSSSGGVGGGSDGAHPLIVKILDGGTLHSVVDDGPGSKKADGDPTQQQQLCERVQFQRLERQKKAKVERVESSEDSTSSSSDLASASPAAENGTTDPSWSSSSSSLAGYGSSKEDPATSNVNPSSSTVASAASVPATAMAASSSSSSMSAAIVASSACSHCSNANYNNPTCTSYNNNNNNNNNKDSISSSGTSSSSGAGTHDHHHDEPSSSCPDSTSSKSYSVHKDTYHHQSSAVPQSEQQNHAKDITSSNLTNNESSVITSIETDTDTCIITNTDTNSNNNTCNNVVASSSSASCSHRHAKSFPTTTTTTSTATTTNTSDFIIPSERNSFEENYDSTPSRVVVAGSSGQQFDCGGNNNNNDNNNGEEPDFGFPCERMSTLTGPEIVVTQESDPEEDCCSSHSSNDNANTRHGYSSDGEEDSIVCNGKAVDSVASDGGGSSAGEGDGSAASSSNRSSKGGFLRVESNDSTAENYGDDDDYNFDDEDDEDDLSHCSVATINRYGTFESLEKLESEDTVGGLPDFPRSMPRSKARFTFEDDDDDDDDLFEEDFETDFNFRFPSQIQDNTYSVSRLGPLPPLLEEDFEDDMYDEQRASGYSPSSSSAMGEYSGGVGPSAGCSSSNASLRTRHEVPTVAVQRVSTLLSSTTTTTGSHRTPSNSSSFEFSAMAGACSSPLASSPLVARAQKLVIVKSSESEMIIFAEAAGNGNMSSQSEQASTNSSESSAGKRTECGSNEVSSSRSNVATLFASNAPLSTTGTAAAGSPVPYVASNSSTNTSI